MVQAEPTLKPVLTAVPPPLTGGAALGPPEPLEVTLSRLMGSDAGPTPRWCCCFCGNYLEVNFVMMARRIRKQWLTVVVGGSVQRWCGGGILMALGAGDPSHHRRSRTGIRWRRTGGPLFYNLCIHTPYAIPIRRRIIVSASPAGHTGYPHHALLHSHPASRPRTFILPPSLLGWLLIFLPSRLVSFWPSLVIPPLQDAVNVTEKALKVKRHPDLPVLRRSILRIGRGRRRIQVTLRITWPWPAEKPPLLRGSSVSSSQRWLVLGRPPTCVEPSSSLSSGADKPVSDGTTPPGPSREGLKRASPTSGSEAGGDCEGPQQEERACLPSERACLPSPASWPGPAPPWLPEI